MLLKSVIEDSVREQLSYLHANDIGQGRKMVEEIKLGSDFITIISGIRRCGKSTLLFQLINNLGENFAYFNFEDPRVFGFDVGDFTKLEEIFADRDFYFFDEIQNIEKWELFIRKLHDRKKTICITGSNASLLSKELGTRLTGRNVQKELFPFDYAEFCKYLNLEYNQKSLEEYLTLGGFPTYLNTRDITYLQQLFKDILYRDIIVRYGVRNTKVIESIALFLISNVAKEFSFTSIKNTFNVGSANSVVDYVSWFEDSYLLFSVPRFSWSLKSISVSPKKVYTIDTGFIAANSSSFSADKGRLFENMVFLHLRRTCKEMYYFKEKGECDFLVKEKNTVKECIQVCYQLSSDNQDREINGLLEAMKMFSHKKGTLITLNQNDSLVFEDKVITVISADKWLSATT